jgi:aminopeptidase YwaD
MRRLTNNEFSRSVGLRIVICALLLLVAAGPVLADPLPQLAQAAFDQKVVARVDAGRALEHIAYLSETIGPRPAGMEAEWEGAEYVASVLESYGYAVEIQPFPVQDQFIGSVELVSGEQWPMRAAPRSLMTGEGSISGELILVHPGTDPSDFPPETAGNIVLMLRRPTPEGYRPQVALAQAAGASAVILDRDIRPPGYYCGAWAPDLRPRARIPVLGACCNHGEWLKDMLAQGSVTLSIQTKRHRNLESVNVIGIKPATSGDPDADVVLVTAHLDSVVGAPGANDNASGVALALELARVFRNYNTDKELRVALFGAEELGVVGSRHYVNQLSDQELDRILGVFNADMVATSDPVVSDLYAMSVDGLPNLVTDAAEAAGSRLGNSEILPAQLGRSDHRVFHEVGVPAALFIWMRVDSEDPLQFYLEEIYHTPQDTLAENISPGRMQSALDIVGAAVFDLIRKAVPALENSRVRAGP